MLFNEELSGVSYISASTRTTGVVVMPNSSGEWKMPTIPIEYGIATPINAVLSMTEETIESGGKYVKVLNYGLTISKYYNSAANIYNSQELLNS